MLVLLALAIASQGQVTKPPELVSSVPPIYPEEAKSAHQEGTVALQVTIDETGVVTRVDVVESAGVALDWAALGAVTNFEFSPAEIDGAPAPVAITYRLEFKLPKAAPVEAPVKGSEPVVEDARAKFTLSGRVRRQSTVEPLALAEVVVMELLPEGKRGAPSVVMTDDDGRFAFPPLPEGPYAIEVGLDGYDPFKDEQYFDPRQHELDIALEPKQADEFLTVVRRRRGEPPVARVSLSRDEVKGIPGTYGDALRVIESLPGVARAPLLGGALMVRGGYPADTAILFEGVPIPILYHFGGFTSVVNGAFIDEINFMPGGFPVRYGNATAGIVDVRAHELDNDTFESHFDGDLFDFGFFFGGHVQPVDTLPKLRIGFAARRSHAEIPVNGFLGAASALGYPIPFAPVPLYYDYQLKLESDVTQTSRLSLFMFGAEDTWAVLGDVPAVFQDADGEDVSLDDVLNTFLGSRFHRLLGSWELRPLPGVTHTLRPYVGITRRGLLSEGVAVPLLAGTTLDTPTDELNWGLRDELSVRILPWLRTNAGVEMHASLYELNLVPGGDLFGFRPPDELPAAVQASLSSTALYGELQLGPSAGLSVTPGVRAELSSLSFEEVDGKPFYRNGTRSGSIVDAFTVAPRVTLRYSLFDDVFALKAAFGLFHQRPRAQSAAFDIDGDELVPPEALQIISGFEARLTDSLSLDAQVYGIRRYGLVREHSRFYTPGNVQPPPISTAGEFDSFGSGDTLGFELLLRHAPSKYFFGWISYTFSRTAVSLGDKREPSVPFPFDQTHNLVMVGKVILPWEITLGARFAFVTGNPRPIADSITTQHELNTNSYQPVLSSLRPSRLDPFHRLDLRIDRRFLFDWASVVPFLEIINVYNYPNPEIVFPGGDYRSREVRTLLPGPPILPLIGAEVDL